jgi:dTDP-glucose pyrophosphorylase
MAGAGTRFKEKGYVVPKPLIDIQGKPMIQRVVESIGIQDNYIFLVRNEHIKQFKIDKTLRDIVPQCTIVPVNYLTEGVACTVLLAKEFINNSQPLFIINSDQILSWDYSTFLQYHIKRFHGSILCFKSQDPACSYVRLKNERVVETAEKKVISEYATVGAYYWADGSDYVKYAEQMIRQGRKVKGEYYVAPVYNMAIEDGLKIGYYLVKEFWNIGTPEGLDTYIRGGLIWK